MKADLAPLQKLMELIGPNWSYFVPDIFRLPDNRGVVILSEEVLSHIYKFAQTSTRHKEAGGQFFSSTPESSVVRVTLATGPYQEDKRSRFGFNPDVNKATEACTSSGKQLFLSASVINVARAECRVACTRPHSV